MSHLLNEQGQSIAVEPVSRVLRGLWGGASLLVGVTILILSLKPQIVVGEGDKLAHIVAYGVWTAVSLMVVSRIRNALIVIAITCVTGVAIEVVQPFVGRDGSIGDIAANAIGIAVGCVLAFQILRPLQRLLRACIQPAA